MDLLSQSASLHCGSARFLSALQPAFQLGLHAEFGCERNARLFVCGTTLGIGDGSLSGPSATEGVVRRTIGSFMGTHTGVPQYSPRQLVAVPPARYVLIG